MIPSQAERFCLTLTGDVAPLSAQPPWERSSLFPPRVVENREPGAVKQLH